jgi:hypothetical protein
VVSLFPDPPLTPPERVHPHPSRRQLHSHRPRFGHVQNQRPTRPVGIHNDRYRTAFFQVMSTADHDELRPAPKGEAGRMALSR